MIRKNRWPTAKNVTVHDSRKSLMPLNTLRNLMIFPHELYEISLSRVPVLPSGFFGEKVWKYFPQFQSVDLKEQDRYPSIFWF